MMRRISAACAADDDSFGLKAQSCAIGAAQHACGIGQSSWGPTGFAFSAGPAEADRLADIARSHPCGRGLDIRVCAGFNRAAEIAVDPAGASLD